MSEREPLRPSSDSQREATQEAVSLYEAALTGEAGEAARQHLRARGITKAAARTFRLGVVETPAPGHERFKGMLAIPYLSPDGTPLTVRFRCIQEHDHREFHHGKYMTVPEDQPRMFNVGAIVTADMEISVCEGEMDAIILCMVGIPAVAIPGAQLWRPHYRRALDGFQRIWLWGDPDEAGGEFNNKLSKAMRRAKAVRLEHGDVNDTYLAGGADALRTLIERGDSQ